MIALLIIFTLAFLYYYHIYSNYRKQWRERIARAKRLEQMWQNKREEP